MEPQQKESVRIGEHEIEISDLWKKILRGEESPTRRNPLESEKENHVPAGMNSSVVTLHSPNNDIKVSACNPLLLESLRRQTDAQLNRLSKLSQNDIPLDQEVLRAIRRRRRAKNRVEKSNHSESQRRFVADFLLSASPEVAHEDTSSQKRRKLHRKRMSSAIRIQSFEEKRSTRMTSMLPSYPRNTFNARRLEAMTRTRVESYSSEFPGAFRLPCSFGLARSVFDEEAQPLPLVSKRDVIIAFGCSILELYRELPRFYKTLARQTTKFFVANAARVRLCLWELDHFFLELVVDEKGNLVEKEPVSRASLVVHTTHPESLKPLQKIRIGSVPIPYNAFGVCCLPQIIRIQHSEKKTSKKNGIGFEQENTKRIRLFLRGWEQLIVFFRRLGPENPSVFLQR